MKVLVTGAGGFIGRYLLPRLAARGHSVIATDLRLPAAVEAGPNIAWQALDVSRPDEVYRAMLGERPEAVIHLVSWLAAPCEADPLRGWEINFLSTQYLLDAGRAAGLRRFVFTSSISVFGRGLPEPVRDDAVKEPATIYGQTKLACEHLLRWYRDKHGLAVGAARFPWVYGPGREHGITAAYSSRLLDAIALGQPLDIDFGEEKGDWLYVRDAVKALLLLLDAGPLPQVAYNIMGSLHSVREAMAVAQRVVPGARVSFRDAARPSDNPYPLSYDDSAARRDIGWAPDYSLEAGIREHVALVRGAPAP
ncbi:MAG TPA: NAD(P)-dependent oxidoreductase [Candidatus Desulfobacillus sp.]|nr:NAD(P)-dependent oxidoreductase [Candidatus Desulfobacillus sp.]